jgi:hypothetical protein
MTLCVTSQCVFIVVVHFIIDSVRKLLDTPSYVPQVRKESWTIDRCFVLSIIELWIMSCLLPSL